MAPISRCIREGHTFNHLVYRLTCQEFDDLARRAEGRCERCGSPAVKLVLDHDHAVGQHAARGLLCHSCNLIVAAVERGQRRDDEATTVYLAHPFYKTIPPESPGLRPRPDSGAFEPRPVWDRRMWSCPAENRISVAEAAELLHVTERDVKKMIATGRLPAMKSGRGWVIRPEMVQRLIPQGEAEVAVVDVQRRKHADALVDDLRLELGLLLREPDPVERDRHAVQLIDAAKGALTAVRRAAVAEAKASGVRPAEFARRRGISRAAIGHLTGDSKES